MSSKDDLQYSIITIAIVLFIMACLVAAYHH